MSKLETKLSNFKKKGGGTELQKPVPLGLDSGDQVLSELSAKLTE